MRSEEYVKVYVAYSPEISRKLRAEKARTRGQLAATLFWLTLNIEHGSSLHGTLTKLADLADVHRNTMRRYLLRLEALGIGRYDAREKVLRLNPLMVFRGSEKERQAVIERWVKGRRRHMEAVG